MSLKQSIYVGMRDFATKSASVPQYSQAIKYGAGAMAAYGAVNGALSDRQTVLGGAVGGGAFGAAAGAAVAYGMHRSGAAREMVQSGLSKAKAAANIGDID